MTEKDKRLAIREFFTAPRPTLHPPTLVIGGCSAFLGVLSALTGDGSAGLILAGLGTVIGIFLPARPRVRTAADPDEVRAFSILNYPEARDRYRARLSADRIVTSLMDDIGRLRDESARRLDLDHTTRDPVCVVGPLYSEEVEGIDPGLVLRRKAPSGYLYSTYRITVFQFSEAFLGAYQCNFSLIENRVTSEETAELFYRDVVSIRTSVESSNRLLKNGERLTKAQIFSLAVASGERIRILMDAPAIELDDRIRTLGEDAAANIRAMLRQYKQPLEDSL